MKDPVKHCSVYKEVSCSHVDGILCDFETCDMRLKYENKYIALKMLVDEHNKSCDSECQTRVKYCVDYLAIGRRCNDCPKHYKIEE